jgi:hypothetical protein
MTATNSNTRTPTGQERKYSKYIMWPVVATVAIWSVLRWIVKLFDAHSATVAAVATIVIGFLTYQYVKYSEKQWRVTSDQLTAYENTEGAHIGVGQLQWDVSGDQIRIPVENYGHIPSPSVHLFPHMYRFIPGPQPSVVYARDYDFGGDQTEIPPGSGKYGVSIPVELRSGEMDKLQNGTELMWVAVTIWYEDGFGHVSKPGTCFAFNPKHPLVWDGCPTFDVAHLPKKQP